MRSKEDIIKDVIGGGGVKHMTNYKVRLAMSICLEEFRKEIIDRLEVEKKECFEAWYFEQMEAFSDAITIIKSIQP